MYRTYVHNVAEFHATEAGKSSTCQQRLPINREPLAIFLYASELEEKGYFFFQSPFSIDCPLKWGIIIGMLPYVREAMANMLAVKNIAILHAEEYFPV